VVVFHVFSPSVFIYVTCHQGVSVRYFYAVTGGVVRYFRTIARGSVRYFRTVTSVAHFRVIASEVVFGVNFRAISLETLRCAQKLTNLFMFLYQKGVRSQKSHQVTLSAVHWQVAPLHQPLSPTTSPVVPGVSSSPRTLFSERHFWGAVRTLTLATVLPYPLRVLCRVRMLRPKSRKSSRRRLADIPLHQSTKSDYRDLLIEFEQLAARFQSEHGRPAVLIFDNIDLIARDPKLLYRLQKGAKAVATRSSSCSPME
jgi:hypothetical protein